MCMRSYRVCREKFPAARVSLTEQISTAGGCPSVVWSHVKDVVAFRSGHATSEAFPVTLGLRY